MEPRKRVKKKKEKKPRGIFYGALFSLIWNFDLDTLSFNPAMGFWVHTRCIENAAVRWRPAPHNVRIYTYMYTLLYRNTDVGTGILCWTASVQIYRNEWTAVTTGKKFRPRPGNVCQVFNCVYSYATAAAPQIAMTVRLCVKEQFSHSDAASQYVVMYGHNDW